MISAILVNARQGITSPLVVIEPHRFNTKEARNAQFKGTMDLREITSIAFSLYSL